MAPAAKRETTEPEISVEQVQLAVTGRRFAISCCPVAGDAAWSAEISKLSD